MFLLVLDKDPVKSAKLVPDGIKFKQLIELCQLINSAYDFKIMKSISQGKQLQIFIKNNPEWTLVFYCKLMSVVIQNPKIKVETREKLINTGGELAKKCKYYLETPQTAIFRYSKDYECNISTDTELSIDECIEQYKKYIEWKKEKGVRGY